MKYPKNMRLLLHITLMMIHQYSVYDGQPQLVAAGAAGGGTVEFSYTQGFNNSDKLQHNEIVGFSNGTMQMLEDPTNTSSNLIGRVVYDRPIGFTANSSFNVSFSFSLNIRVDSTGYADCPSGLAFFISPDGSVTPPDNSGGRYYGLVDPNTGINSTTNATTDPLFAVVFDAANDGRVAGLDDPSASYAAIDVDSLIPRAYVNTDNVSGNIYFPNFFLCENNTFSVKIAYSASSENTKLFVTSGSSRLNSTVQNIVLNYTNNLYSSVFSKNAAFYVGFSVTNYRVGTPPSSVAIQSWQFSVDNTAAISSAKSSPNLALILPLALAASAVLIAIFIASLIYLRRHHMKQTSNLTTTTFNNIESAANSLQKFSYKDLKTSTRDFDPNTSLIGEGGFSKVYKGILANGSVIAIKRLKDSSQKEGEFALELNIISSIRHRNLLQLEGWSYDKGEALLVYKFMSNGSLDQYLFGSKKGTLDGDTRLKILQGVAAALEYLHSGLGECILHRDIKAANVMLTEDFEAALGDFGLARLIKHNEVVTATMVGTPGYVAPEIFMTGKVTDKVDVYSFGILMLEVACGSPTINREQDAKYVYLKDWMSSLQSNENVLEGLDPSILMLCQDTNLVSKVKEQWTRLLELALMCCHISPNFRPPMRYINQYIQDVINDPWTKSPSMLSFKSPNDANMDGDEEAYLNYLNFYSSSSSQQSNFTSLKYSTDYLFSSNSNSIPNK